MPLLLREGVFVRSGFIYLVDGRYWNVTSGRWWSSLSYSDTASAYSLDFGESGVFPSSNNDLYRGFPLRCLSTVLDM